MADDAWIYLPQSALPMSTCSCIWQSQLQAEVEDKAMKRREQQAEYDRMSEINRGRLEASDADTTDAGMVRPDAEACAAVQCCAAVQLQRTGLSGPAYLLRHEGAARFEVSS